MRCLTPDGQSMNDSFLLKENTRLLSRYKQYVEGKRSDRLYREVARKWITPLVVHA